MYLLSEYQIYNINLLYSNIMHIHLIITFIFISPNTGIFDININILIS